MSLFHVYRIPALTPAKKRALLGMARRIVSAGITDIQTEYCFNIESTAPLTDTELSTLRWLLAETYEPNNCGPRSFLVGVKTHADAPFRSGTRHVIVEVGPRLNFTTAWSTNAVAICHACGLTKIARIERSRRYKVIFDEGSHVYEDRSQDFASRPPSLPTDADSQEDDLDTVRIVESFLPLIHDRMTECLYPEPLTTFETGITPEPVFLVPLIEEGKDALERLNRAMGLGLDDRDIDYYYNLFVHEIGRNPTNVECFDLAQSNSEHSRHWFFKGRLILDGVEAPQSLMEMVTQPLFSNPGNSLIAFKDNSSAIRGYHVRTIIPDVAGAASRFRPKRPLYHIIFTAETHNFPTGVAPFPGAETGTGGRIRDVHATGRGSLVIAGTAGYCVGNLHIPNYALPWEDQSFAYPPNLASPLQIEIEASNGASDYGNKFGEPIIQGFTRSFGLRLAQGERYEWVKPIMFTGGVGQIDDRHITKGMPEKGMRVVKVGGPAYRIGIGGGAASSMIQGENIAELDFSAVQRGDAEMEQKVNRVIRACVEMGDRNPIVSIHDQGAGGNCNVIKEIVYPAGARIEIRNILVGDATLSVLEIWGAEYQEQDALLLRAERIDEFMAICKREKVPCSIIGEITGDGYIVIHDEVDDTTPVNLELSKVLGAMPRKTFHLERVPRVLKPLRLPEQTTPMEVLHSVLRLLSVGSKRFLTNKVDRSVTGLIAQQQCVGPLQLTLSNVAVVSQSHFGLTGAAIAIGEQPIKGLVDPAAMARMSVGEALTNIVWAKVSAFEDIKCSGNWMWAAKLPGEGARLYTAAEALRDILCELGIAIDGGKDSLSMAAKVMDGSGDGEIVKAPGTLVISAYATCPDITKVISPDIKRPGESRLLYIDLAGGRYRMGGSALSQVYGQIGNEVPDVDVPGLLKRAFVSVQELIERGLILSGHDRSDGGLVVTLLEMAFGGNCGLDINIDTVHASSLKKTCASIRDQTYAILFSEELGFVVEYLPDREREVMDVLKRADIPFSIVGETTSDPEIVIRIDGEVQVNAPMRALRAVWEETSYRLESLQTDPECADEERDAYFDRRGPAYRLTFTPDVRSSDRRENDCAPFRESDRERGVSEAPGDQTLPKVAILREEGSNGDREMASAFYQAGFDVWDVTMTDLLSGTISLDAFRGVAFVGGFSYADVLDSAKGWAGVIRFNDTLYRQFQRFYERHDTFSLGVCNGCQLMALLGWVPWRGLPDEKQPRFVQNKSGRFESRFSTVLISPSPSIMLRGMEGSVLGIWIAHGEGRLLFPDEEVMREVMRRELAPIRYVDDDNRITETYPFNPNGSPEGVTALCSPDGRHLAMMPHPERTFLTWQWAYMPTDWKDRLTVSPWFRMFQNARQWCS